MQQRNRRPWIVLIITSVWCVYTAMTSLHGWLWLVGALIGTPIGVRLRTWCEVA